MNNIKQIDIKSNSKKMQRLADREIKRIKAIKLSKDKKKAKDNSTQKNEQELFTVCYENEIHFEQYSPYHYRLFYDGNILDVWPVSKKFWQPGMGNSRVYSKPNELLQFLIKNL